MPVNTLSALTDTIPTQVLHDQHAKKALREFDFDNIRFGEKSTDFMFSAEYRNKEWQDTAIVPFANLSLSPFSLCFHYGQTAFEGMKAFRHIDGRISIFRPWRHLQRFNKSLERMCMPVISAQMFLDGLEQLVWREREWLPVNRTDIALYIRPFVIATESRLGVKVSDQYRFLIACTAAGNYYDQPLKVKVETQYVRATEGGAGYAKCGGNYGAAFYPSMKAKEAGYDQVLWTDGRHNEFIEESGMMNIMFFIGGKLITPVLSDSILDGVTRDSILQLAKDLNVPTDERKISYHELVENFKAGNRVEAFGVGTAAVLSPISRINIEGNDYETYVAEDAFMYQLKKMLTEIRVGLAVDKHNWNHFL